MWTKKTARNLRAQLEVLYETISDAYASGNRSRYNELAAQVRRVEVALARLTVGRVR